MATWTYLARDLLTRRLLAELPLRGVNLTSRLDQAGELRATLPLVGMPRLRAGTMDGASTPARTTIEAWRDDRLIWGGIIWSRPYSNQTYTVQAKEWRSAFARRLIKDVTYTQVDQLAIAQDLLARAQTGGTAWALGVVIGAERSGVLRDHSYATTDAKPTEEAVQQLADLQSGFEWRIDLPLVGGAAQPVVRMGYPRVGQDVDHSGLVWEYMPDAASSIVDYEWPDDGTGIAARVLAIGGTPEGAAGPITSVAVNTAMLASGMPAWEASTSATDVTIQATLNDHAGAELVVRGSTLVEPSLTVRADAFPRIGDWSVGDDARLRIFGDARWPDGLDTAIRTTGWDITPTSGPDETVKVQVAPVPSALVRRIARAPRYGSALLDLTRRVRTLET